MDAEIALEMAMERQRRLSTTSNNSSGGGTYVGPRPNSPGQVGGTLLESELIYCRRVQSLHWLCLPLQDEEVQCVDRDLLSPRKMSVSRMHSLPNDSYMFRPVRPASAPYSLEEVELSPQHQHSGK